MTPLLPEGTLGVCGWAASEGSSQNYQPAEVLEADVELVPSAHLPAVGAVDVVCRDRWCKVFSGVPALCRSLECSQVGDTGGHI